MNMMYPLLTGLGESTVFKSSLYDGFPLNIIVTEEVEQSNGETTPKFIT